MHRDQDLICSNYCVNSQYSQRRGAFYQDIVVIAFDGLNSIPQDLLSHEDTRKSWLILRKTDVGGNQIYSLIMMEDDVIELYMFLTYRGFDDI